MANFQSWPEGDKSQEFPDGWGVVTIPPHAASVNTTSCFPTVNRAGRTSVNLTVRSEPSMGSQLKTLHCTVQGFFLLKHPCKQQIRNHCSLRLKR